MITCGIDLGTTNSCIFVVDREGQRVISDEYGHQIFPSVVYVGHDGRPRIGYSAKNRMGERPGPVATIKRKMGSTERVLLGREMKTPVEVSAMILTYLKELAEKETKEEVDRAVVTVPAYFNHVQRQQTDEAGKRAGFREVVTLLEPVAAALAYSLSQEAERLRVFVYDLGGGTFDATVLEKDRYGGITVLSFGGDPFLGGDDVDARLARVLIQKLTEKGYRLDLNLDRPEDFSRFQRLKHFAEMAKKDLSEKEEVALVHQGFLQDDQGETIDLDLVVTRKELEECARDLIERSIEASVKTLEKKDISKDSIDRVIMVGGMSRMPLVQRMLAEMFGRNPEIVDPDLIVARGAAIKAASVFAEVEIAPSGLRLELHYDRKTDQDQTRISGLFDRPLKGHTAYLLGDESELSVIIQDTDRFTFEHVPLKRLSENSFTLSIEDADDNPVIERQIKIVHESDPRRILASPGSVVTKPIQIWTKDGLEVLFPENTALPYSVVHTFETSDQSGRIVAPMWEGSHEVERLEIHDIPQDLKIGTPVIIEVRVEKNYQIHAKATVPDIEREVSIKFSIDPVDTSKITPEFVQERLAALDQQAEEAKAQCPSKEAVEIFWFDYRQVRGQVEVELSEMEPQRAKLHEKLGELAALIQKIPTKGTEIQLKPTYEAFSERLRSIVNQARQDNHPKLPQILPQIEALEERAKTVWKEKDSFAWRRIQDQVEGIARALMPELTPEEKALGIAAWLITDQLPEMKKVAGGGAAREIEAIIEEVTEIFMRAKLHYIEAEAAADLLIGIYRSRVAPLRQALGLTSVAEVKVGDAQDVASEGIVRKRK
jgi:molecular chaperone DnaK (HSP70)